jgi:hypothetical protein
MKDDTDKTNTAHKLLRLMNMAECLDGHKSKQEIVTKRKANKNVESNKRIQEKEEELPILSPGSDSTAESIQVKTTNQLANDDKKRYTKDTRQSISRSLEGNVPTGIRPLRTKTKVECQKKVIQRRNTEPVKECFYDKRVEYLDYKYEAVSWQKVQLKNSVDDTNPDDDNLGEEEKESLLSRTSENKEFKKLSSLKEKVKQELLKKKIFDGNLPKVAVEPLKGMTMYDIIK